MYFFKGGKDGLNRSVFKAFGENMPPIASTMTPFFAKLTGDEQPKFIGALLLILVLLLHLWVALWLLKPDQPITKPKQQMIEVSLVAAPVQRPKAAAPAPAVAEKKPVIQKPVEPKTQPKKKPPVIPKKITPPKPKPVVDDVRPTFAPVVPQPVAKPEPSQEISSHAPSQQSSAPQSSHSNTDGITSNKSGGGERVTCVYCPQIKYPRAAQRRNLQGSVLLRLELSAGGDVQSVTVTRSSGHEVLDEAALANVKKWRFIPGQSGVVRVATQLINFKM
ncbi:MAG: energy transducer TonB [Methylococcaceae bacterium]